MASFGMQQVHKDALRTCRLRLVQEMDPEPVLQRLKDLNVLTDCQCESIMVKPAKHEKNGAILDIVPKKGPEAFKKFCQSLTASGNDQLRRLIDGNIPCWRLSERTVLTVRARGIMLQRGPRRVNIPFEAWIRLMELIPNIQQTVNNWTQTEVSEEQFPLSEGKSVLVSVFQEKMYVGFHSFENGVLVKGEGLNLGMEEWTVFLQVMDSIHEEVCCCKPAESAPDTYRLIDIVYR